MAGTWTLRDWAKLQHYTGKRAKGGPGPWIKAYRDRLDDQQFRALSVHARDLLRDMELMAAESKGEVPADPANIAWRLRVASKTLAKPLRELLTAGFIVGSDELLAACEQYASDALAQSREEKTREEETEEVGKPPATAPEPVEVTPETIAPDLFVSIPTAYHPAVVGALKSAKNPAAVAASIRALGDGLHHAYSWDLIGRALADWHASGEPFKARTLDVFCGDLARRANGAEAKPAEEVGRLLEAERRKTRAAVA